MWREKKPLRLQNHQELPFSGNTDDNIVPVPAADKHHQRYLRWKDERPGKAGRGRARGLLAQCHLLLYFGGHQRSTGNPSLLVVGSRRAPALRKPPEPRENDNHGNFHTTSGRSVLLVDHLPLVRPRPRGVSPGTAVHRQGYAGHVFLGALRPEQAMAQLPQNNVGADDRPDVRHSDPHRLVPPLHGEAAIWSRRARLREHDHLSHYASHDYSQHTSDQSHPLVHFLTFVGVVHWVGLLPEAVARCDRDDLR